MSDEPIWIERLDISPEQQVFAWTAFEGALVVSGELGLADLPQEILDALQNDRARTRFSYTLLVLTGAEAPIHSPRDPLPEHRGAGRGRESAASGGVRVAGARASRPAGGGDRESTHPPPDVQPGTAGTGRRETGEGGGAEEAPGGEFWGAGGAGVNPLDREWTTLAFATREGDDEEDFAELRSEKPLDREELELLHHLLHESLQGGAEVTLPAERLETLFPEALLYRSLLMGLARLELFLYTPSTFLLAPLFVRVKRSDKGGTFLFELHPRVGVLGPLPEGFSLEELLERLFERGEDRLLREGE